MAHSTSASFFLDHATAVEIHSPHRHSSSQGFACDVAYAYFVCAYVCVCVGVFESCDDDDDDDEDADDDDNFLFFVLSFFNINYV